MDSDYIRTFESTFGMLVKFKTPEGEVVGYNPKHILGFFLKGIFFRTVGKEIAMLTNTESVNNFINGFAGISLIEHPDRTSGGYLEGQSSCYICGKYDGKAI